MRGGLIEAGVGRDKVRTHKKMTNTNFQAAKGARLRLRTQLKNSLRALARRGGEEARLARGKITATLSGTSFAGEDPEELARQLDQLAAPFDEQSSRARGGAVRGCRDRRR